MSAQTILVAPGSAWKHLDPGANLGTAWRLPGFNDSAWPSGPAQLGYGDGDEATVVSFGPDPNAKYITTYFRRAVTVATPAAFTNLLLGVLREDGAIVYLSGAEIWRSNLPTGTVTDTTLALTAVSGSDETTFHKTPLSPGLLRPGTNVLAGQVHQVSPTSSDLSLDLFLRGQPTPVPVAWALQWAGPGRRAGPSSRLDPPCRLIGECVHSGGVCGKMLPDELGGAHAPECPTGQPRGR